MKPSNECFMCRNRFCANGVISVADKGDSLNEIACQKHTDALYEKANEVLGKGNGVERLHVGTTGTLSRNLMKSHLENWLKEKLEEETKC